MQLESVFKQLETLQSHIYSTMKETEAKIPENFETLRKLSKNFAIYQKQSGKMKRKSSKIDKKIKDFLVELESKLELDESNYAAWSGEEVVRFVRTCTTNESLSRHDTGKLFTLRQNL